MSDREFVGAVAELYEKLLVPMIFDSYAADLAARIDGSPRRVLEIAAGTGALTRRLAGSLPPTASIIATDLNPPMLERGKRIGTARPVEWQIADASSLPFPDASFDVVVCQFGAMFFPDKAQAYSEVRRVLAPQGRFFFNVWDRIEDNEFAAVVEEVVVDLFPGDPPRFMSRTPHGYYDTAKVARDLAAGGFSAKPVIETVAEQSRSESARIAATAYCMGTPLRNEIEKRDPAALETAVERSTTALEQRFGSGPITGKIQAHVISIPR